MSWFRRKPKNDPPDPEVVVRFHPDAVQGLDVQTATAPSLTPDEFIAFGEWTPGAYRSEVVVKHERTTIRLSSNDTKVEVWTETENG